MFIVRDHRKLEEILADESEVREGWSTRERLLLGRRAADFKGNLRRLCQPRFLPRLAGLHTLSLYESGIEDVSGIGVFGELPKLADLNLGRNKLKALPEEFSRLRSLRALWLEDNDFDTFPSPVLELEGLAA